jgi:RimJ/RimL family protein N-acetyltransferase
VSFDYQPVLLGTLVRLRPLQLADHDALYAVAADPLIWEQHPDKTRCTAAGFLAFFRQALESGGALLVSDAETSQISGSSRFHGYDETKGEVEIGWTFLAWSLWGGRYNAEVKYLVLQHAFRFVRQVVFVIGPSNLRSQQAIEKIGGVRTGSRPDASGRDSYLFTITASACGSAR